MIVEQILGDATPNSTHLLVSPGRLLGGHLPRMVLAATLAGWLADRLGLPAGWLLGPMLLTLAITIWSGRQLLMPTPVKLASQGVIGVVISSGFQPAALTLIVHNWLIVLLSATATLGMSVTTSLLLARMAPIDRASAALGSVPGAASGMITMSEDLGADPRLVAFLQYLRVILVVIIAPLLARYVLAPGEHHRGGAALPVVAPAIVSCWAYGLTPLVILLGLLLGVRGRVPAGALLGPMLLSLGLNASGLLVCALPPGAAQAAYALLGIQVGLLFDPEVMRRMGRTAPAAALSTVLLMTGCGAMGWILCRVTGIDGLTAYLATVPGGLDTVTITALHTGGDTSLVLAMQLVRMLAVIVAGPLLVRRLLRPSRRRGVRPDGMMARQ